MIDKLKQLRELLGDTYRDLLKAYLDDSPKRLDQMQSSFRELDFESLANTAHIMKGSSGNMGAQKLSEVCAEIEKLARNNSIDRLEEKIGEVGLAYQDVKKILEQEISSIL
ncbi:MAG: Hpt domain-containing protein [Gammaproteobacteria bacterium]|nr:Hpt domain-containing protein [Gammaproteobacteria bacterium]